MLADAVFLPVKDRYDKYLLTVEQVEGSRSRLYSSVNLENLSQAYPYAFHVDSARLARSRTAVSASISASEPGSKNDH
jgi:hypothetical protein